MVIINNENKTLEAVIALDGAELLSVRRDSYEYMWQANSKYWNRTAPVLFPFVGRLKENQYTVDQQTFELNQHGFARDMRFAVKNQTETSVTFVLESNEETKSKYPFEFCLEITYTFENNDLKIQYLVTNTNNETMYYSIGGHPGFNLEPNKNYEFKLNQAEKRYNLNGAYIGEIVENKELTYQVQAELFANDALIFETSSPEKEITILEEGVEYIKMKYNDFKLMGVWAPLADEVPFLCLEPWNGIADFDQKTSSEIKDKEFINELAAKESANQEYTITFY